MFLNISGKFSSGPAAVPAFVALRSLMISSVVKACDKFDVSGQSDSTSRCWFSMCFFCLRSFLTEPLRRSWCATSFGFWRLLWVAPPRFCSRLHARLLECVKSSAAFSSDHQHNPSFKDVMSFLPVSGSPLSLFAEPLVVFTPRWYAIDNFSNAFANSGQFAFQKFQRGFCTDEIVGMSKPIVIMLGLRWLFGKCGSMVRVVGRGWCSSSLVTKQRSGE